MARLNEHYKNNIVSSLMKSEGYKNPYEVPKILKIVLNVGVGDATADPKLLDASVFELTLISGQKAIKRKAKKSEAGFKLRKGMNIGCMVTLRRERMYEFLDRLLNIALPRIRDFRGLSLSSFDGYGNYTLGIKEQIIFPEIDYDKVSKIRGMNITFVTTAKTDKEAKVLLEQFGFPFLK